MAGKKGGLGRGLDSLFGDSAVLQTPTPVERPAETKAAPKKAAPKKEAAGAAEAAESVVYIKLNDIKPNASQPRKTFNEEALADLADSIREHGVIQPILLRPAKKGYELVAGERRWRAARLAGLKEVPAIVRDLDERTNAFYALIENMQREDLNAIEEAEGIKEIIDKYGLTQEETSKVVGKSRPYISNALRLLTLPEEVKVLVNNGRLSQGHARAVAGLAGEKLQIEAAQKAAAEGWSVRQIESYTALKPKKKPAKKKASAKKDADTRALEERLSEGLGTRVTVEGSPKRGKIIVEYYSPEELDRLSELLKG
ncbi:MAG: ParB/RepB/Spo0J family partition protein [Firmicutes bacterium]|nr:ParB/RepB/Spo0J family partition protein [Bacillota bacterium]